MSSNQDMRRMVREITDEEVAFYEEHGWVKLDALISPEASAELLSASEKLIDHIRDDLEKDDVKEVESDLGKIRRRQTDDWRGIRIDHPGGAQTLQARGIRVAPFYTLTFDKGLGRAAQRLINRQRFTDEPVAVRYMEDALLCRPPGQAGKGNGTFYHQDHPGFSLDRVGALNFWIALDEVTPDQGGMRFLDRSHLAGPLGPPSAERDLLEIYPKLPERYPWTAPFHYQPGDATVHHQMLVHGAPENAANRARWAYACTYMAADCIHSDGGDGLGMKGSHERFPQVYP